MITAIILISYPLIDLAERQAVSFILIEERNQEGTEELNVRNGGRCPGSST